MKKLINFTLIAMTCMAVACHKDATLTKMAPVAFTSSLTASTSEVILSKNTDATPVVTFNWPAVTYPVKAHVTYTLQVDIPADTLGATAWANDTTVAVGPDILTTTLDGATLNKIGLKYIAAGDTGKLVFRVQAYQDRNAYSQAVTITVSPYVAQVVIIVPPPPASLGQPVLYLPGFYQGWSPGTAGTVAAEQPGIYEGYIYMPESSDPSAYHFKFTSDPDWNHTNYGDGGSGTISTDGLAGDLVLPGPGVYELIINTTTLTWSYTPITFGIIGDATPGGWTTDTQMTYIPDAHVWRVTAKLTTAGSFKFRANNAWQIDFGVDPATNRIGYADNPAYPYNGSIQNLTVSEDGTYIISLDVHDPNAYYYYIQKL